MKKIKKSRPKTTIKLDFDYLKQKDIKKILTTTRQILWFFKIKTTHVETFSTNHGYHIYIHTNKCINPKDLIFYQIGLGSDIHREIRYWKRIKHKHYLKNNGWNILFHKKFYSDGTTSEEKYNPRFSKQILNILTNNIKKNERRQKKKWKQTKQKN